MEIEKIRTIRTNESMRLKPSPYLRKSFRDEYGNDVEVAVRNYQAQGIMNLLQVPRMILADDTGLGKTLQTLCAVGYVWMMEPEYVPIVITRKSSLYQWEAEVRKFMQNMSAMVVDGEPWERDETYRRFFEAQGGEEKVLLVMTYDTFLKDYEQSVVRDRSVKPKREDKAALKRARDAAKVKDAEYAPLKEEFRSRFDQRNDIVKSYLVERLKPADADAPPPSPPSDWTADDEELMAKVTAKREELKAARDAVEAARDAVEPPKVADGFKSRLAAFSEGHEGAKVMLIMDEAHVVKNPRAKLHQAIFELQKSCDRVIAMTATPVKNRLMEFWAILRIVTPFLFPKVTHFQNSYCIIKMQKIGRGRQVPIVVGHSKDQVEAFVAAIEPYYLSRRKHDVAKELPELITREVVCVLSQVQQDLYEMAELEAEMAEEEADPDAPNTAALRCMTLIQQAADAPQLIANEDGVPYEGESSKIEALIEILQDSPDSKVLVYSRLEQMISLIEQRLKREKIACLRITGKESSAKKRREAVDVYQDPSSGVNVMLITAAGTESLNLQATEHIVCVDSPWSWGDYVQLSGRSIRIGSRNLVVLITHLVGRIAGGRKTIDDHVIKKLLEKRKLADSVAGEALKGGLEFREGDMVREVLAVIKGALPADAAATRELVRTRIFSAGHAKRRKKAADQGSLLGLESPSDAPAAAAPRRPGSDDYAGMYLDMTDI